MAAAARVVGGVGAAVVEPVLWQTLLILALPHQVIPASKIHACIFPSTLLIKYK